MQVSVLEQDKRIVLYLGHEDEGYRKHKSLLIVHNVAAGHQYQSYLEADYKSRISDPVPHFSL